MQFNINKKNKQMQIANWKTQEHNKELTKIVHSALESTDVKLIGR